MNKQTAMFTSEQQHGGSTLNMLDQINATEDRIRELRRSDHTFHTDGGHGWLEAKRSDLIMLGIETKISGYSYQSGDRTKVFLEEDCDAGEYVRALWGKLYNSAEYEQWKTLHIKESYRERTPIRQLPHFQTR
jgi:hypothetical protein